MWMSRVNGQTRKNGVETYRATVCGACSTKLELAQMRVGWRLLGVKQ